MPNSHLLSGFLYLMEGFKLIFKPSLKRYALIPLILNIILFAGIFWFSKHYFGLFNHWVILHLPNWLHWLEYLFILIFILVFLLIVFYSFMTLANLIGGPFNSLLSQQVEYYLTGRKFESQNFSALARDIPRLIKRQISLMIYFLIGLTLFFIFSWIPLIQLFTTPLYFIFSAWFLALQLIDYPTDNHRVPLNTVRSQLRKNKMLIVSFGLSILLFSIIPFVNFFVIPAGVAGATKLWLDQSNE
jgi:CysZ protein